MGYRQINGRPLSGEMATVLVECLLDNRLVNRRYDILMLFNLG